MEIAERFAALFRGLKRAHGRYAGELKKDARKGKMLGRASTIKEPVTTDKWLAHLEGKAGIGIVPVDDEGQCRFGAIDVDVYDLDLKQVEREVKAQGLPLVTCRTKSGGAHLYLFLKSGVQAKDVRAKLSEWAASLGWPKSEIFPKQNEIAGEDDVGCWINVPYFCGERTTRYALKDGEALSPEEFLDLAENSMLDGKDLSKIEVKQDDLLKDGPPCLQVLSVKGFPDGTRNKALFNLGVYCKMRYGDVWEDKLEELNQLKMMPPLGAEEVRTIIGSLRKKEYCYTCKDQPIVDACSRSMCVGRKFGIGGGTSDPGVALDGLTKITTQPPTWIMNVDGRRLRLSDTADLIDQNRFVRACVDGLNVLPRRVARPVWDDLVRGLLERLEEVEAPNDAGSEGQIEFLIEQFCTEQHLGTAREELLLARPILEEGWVYFRSFDLIAYMERRRIRATPKEAWNVLRARGAKTAQFNVKGRCVRCWGVPETARQTEGFKVPDTSAGDDF